MIQDCWGSSIVGSVARSAASVASDSALEKQRGLDRKMKL